MTPAFLSPLPLSPSTAATRVCRLPRSPPKPVHRRQQSPKSAWEDTLLPSARPKPSPNNYYSLHLLSLSASDTLAYATAQHLGGPRKPYAMTSSALPLPYKQNERCIITDTLSHLHGTVFSPIPIPPDIPSGLLSTLRLSRADCVTTGNSGLAILQVICSAGAELQSVHVEETPSLGFQLTGVLELRVPAGLVCEEVVYKSESVFVSPAFAVAVGNVAGVEVLVERVLFEEACVVVDDMVAVYEGCGSVPVVEKNVFGDVVVDSDRSGGAVVPWEITAEEVDGLSDSTLRRTLRKYGVGVTRRESRESLLQKFVKLMDEVQRRELGVLLAAREGMYGLAGELQAGRSERGKLLVELKKAEKRGEWNAVMRLGMRIRELENGIMDITSEPGSYSRDLDRDEWYRPNR